MSDLGPGSISVVVVGGGIMGRGIAAALAVAGHPVCVVEPDATTASALLDRVAAQLDSETEIDSAAALARMAVSADLEAVRSAALVIEAVPEDMSIKTPLWQRLGELSAPTATLASNTSALDIDAFAALVPVPERVLGTHWLIPRRSFRWSKSCGVRRPRTP